MTLLYFFLLFFRDIDHWPLHNFGGRWHCVPLNLCLLGNKSQYCIQNIFKYTYFLIKIYLNFRILGSTVWPFPTTFWTHQKCARGGWYKTRYRLRLPRRVRILPTSFRLHFILCLRFWRRLAGVLYWWPYVQVRIFIALIIIIIIIE